MELGGEGRMAGEAQGISHLERRPQVPQEHPGGQFDPRLFKKTLGVPVEMPAEGPVQHGQVPVQRPCHGGRGAELPRGLADLGHQDLHRLQDVDFRLDGHLGLAHPTSLNRMEG